MSRRVWFTVLLLLLGNGALLTAQDARLKGRVPDPVRARIDATLAEARARGLPTEPLVDRALEGVAKGARPDQIEKAVARLRDELGLAREAFGANASVAEVTAGASALRAGATRAELARLRELRPNRSLAVAAGVLADLVAAGVPADTGIAAVLALASHAEDADYIAFRRNVERDISLGASPASSIGARLRTIGSFADEAAAPRAGDGPGTVIPRKRKP